MTQRGVNETVAEIESTLRDVFHPTVLLVSDDSEEHIGHAGADKGHFTVEIASEHFAGLSRLQSHRLIYAALDELMQTKIHALRIVIS
ncbi:MAG: BolA family transcriptional regulator [Gammaproteobacteria bacterium]|nr:BolA family transcriptional regulator [Gammaproteobacteria bacterium]